MTRITCERCNGKGRDTTDRTGGPDLCYACGGKGYIMADCSRITKLAEAYARKVPLRCKS